MVFQVFFLIACFTLAAVEPVKLHLPVRAFKEKNPLATLKKDELTLLIDGNHKEIEALVKKEKSIGRVTGLGKHYILSFLMMGYGKRFETGISYFITEILRPEDTLYIFSPLYKTYPVEIHPNKEKMLREIAGILRKDCYLYSRKRFVAEKKLLSRIRNARRLVTYPFRNQGFFLGIINFFENFPPKFLEFEGQYLLPDIEKYRQAVESLRAGTGEGERWWIHFQEHSLNDVLLQVKNLYHDVDRFFTYSGISIVYRNTLKKKMQDLKKQLTRSGTFSSEQFLETLVRGNINYNIIFPGSGKKNDKDLTNIVPAAVEEILERISIHSGGMTARTSKFDEGVISLKNHVDHYYDLVFDPGSDREANLIRVELQEKQGGVLLVYDDRCTKIEPASASLEHSQEKVKITTFSQEESLIRFSIGSFKIKEDSEKGEGFGLLKVEVLLMDQQGETVYRRRNTLRASQDRLDITLTLPLDRFGTFTLSIDVTDIIANSKTSFQREIIL